MLNSDLIKAARLALAKQAFVPMSAQGAAPQPAPAPMGAPAAAPAPAPMDPAQMGAPPMDPSQGAGAPPMDPAAAVPPSAIPPGGSPAQIVQVSLDDLMQLVMMITGGQAPGAPGAGAPGGSNEPAKPKGSKANVESKLDQILEMLQPLQQLSAPAGGAPMPDPAAMGGNALAPMGGGMAMPEGAPEPLMPMPGGMPPEMAGAGAPPPPMTVAASERPVYAARQEPTLAAQVAKHAKSGAVSLNRIISNLNNGRR